MKINTACLISKRKETVTKEHTVFISSVFGHEGIFQWVRYIPNSVKIQFILHNIGNTANAYIITILIIISQMSTLKLL